MSVEAFLAKSVHPAASILPLMDETEFRDLIEDIRRVGRNTVPITLLNDAILDGRNRARAIEHLQAEGHEIAPIFETWTPTDEETPTEFVQRRNLSRRNLTADQRLACADQMLPMIEQERAELQRRTQIQPGEKRNPFGRRGKGKLAELNSTPPDPAEQRRRNQDKARRSTAGKVAEMAGVSINKARQYQKVKKQHGSAAVQQIANNKATIKDFSPKTPRAKKDPPSFEQKELFTPYVEKKYRQLIDHFDVTDHKHVRKTLLDIVRKEINNFDEPSKRKETPAPDAPAALPLTDPDHIQPADYEPSLESSADVGGGLPV
jgi:hypothetical protein